MVDSSIKIPEQNISFVEKTIPLKDSSDFLVSSILEDFQNWKLCDHPNIAKLKDFFEQEGDQKNIHYEAETEPLTLSDIVNERRINQSPFTKEEFLFYCLQLLSAFSYLQKKNIAHKTISLKNILVSSSGNLKLTNFASQAIYQDIIANNTSENLPPELRGIQKEQIDPAQFLKLDIWRLGVLFFELAKPCQLEDSSFTSITNITDETVERYDKKIIKTLVQMVHPDPQKRYSIKKVFDDFRKYAKQLDISEEKYIIVKASEATEEEKKTSEKKPKAAPKQHTYTVMPTSEIDSYYNDNGKFSSDGKISKDTIKISTWNVNSLLNILRSDEGNNDFIKYFQVEDPDILCITETHLKYQNLDLEILKSHNYTIFHNCHKGNIGRSGVAIMTKFKPLNVLYDIGVPELDEEGRVITLEYEKFYLICCYTPNSGRQLQRLEYRTTKWDPAFKQFMKNLAAKKHVILCGDLNVAHQPIDVHNHKRYAGFTVEEREQFTLLLKEGFVDVFRHLYPQSVEYTFFSSHFDARDQHKGWRLDYFVLNSDAVKAVDKVLIKKQYLGSDHCPMEMIFHLLCL